MNNEELTTKEIPGIFGISLRHVLAFIVLMFIASGCNEKSYNSPTLTEKKYSVAEPTLSPDNKKIIFSIREQSLPADIGIYDISSSKFSKMNPTGKACLSPIYSPDGKKIAFIQHEGRQANVFVMNVDGANVKQVTHSYNDEKKVAPTRDFSPVYKINALPTFSPDGRKIIFLRSGVLRERSMGGEMVSHWDVYEVELATGKERQLTDYRFYAISRPYYLPNDKGIIFSAVNGKGTFPAELNSRKNPSIYVDGKKVNQPYDSLVNEIFIIEENKKPYLAFKHDAFASKPSISRNGDIAFNGFDDRDTAKCILELAQKAACLYSTQISAEKKLLVSVHSNSGWTGEELLPN